MSDLMLHGVLNMPLPDDPSELEPMDWVQFRDRARQASEEIERLTAEVAERDAALDAAENDIGRPWRFWAKKCREMAQRKEGQK